MSTIDDFVAAARSAREVVPSQVVDLDAAGLRVRVNLCGTKVVPVLGRGLLSTDPAGPADSELFAFDSAESGVPLPPPPWPAAAFQGRRQEIPGYVDPPRLAIYDLEHATLSYYDEDASQGVQWFRDAEKMMPGEGGSPLRNLLRWAYGQHDAHMLHLASAAGVLIGGPGGAGKSTSSLACAIAGEAFTSDDFTLVTLGEEGVHAHAVYSCVKVTDPTLELLPGLAGLGEPAGLDWRAKHRFDLSGVIARSQEVSAVVLPQIGERTGAPELIAPAEALRRLTGGSLTVMTGALTRSLGAISALLERLPAYSLTVGPDIDRVPGVLRELGAVGASR